MHEQDNLDIPRCLDRRNEQTAETEKAVAPTPERDRDVSRWISHNMLALARRVKALIEKGDKAAEKAEQFYKAAGIHINEIKWAAPDDWQTIVRDQCGIGRSRAYELMAIADGKTTIEKVRADTNERKKAHRTKPSVPERTEPINQRVTGSAEVSIEQRRADNARLADDGRSIEVGEIASASKSKRPAANCIAQELRDVSQGGSQLNFGFRGDAPPVQPSLDQKQDLERRKADHAALDDDMPSEAEADESWQNDLYEQACLLLSRMADATRQRFCAHLAAGDDIVERTLSLLMAMNKDQRAQFFAKYTELSAAKAPARP